MSVYHSSLEDLVSRRDGLIANLRATAGRGPEADRIKRHIAALDEQIGRVVAEQQRARERVS